MRVLVVGSMKWADEEALRRELRKLPAGCTVLHGDAPAVDALAGRIAREELGLVVEVFAKNDEDYARYGRGAWKGLNERMLASGVDLLLAFHEELNQPGKASGSRHAIVLADGQGIEVRTF